MDSFPRCIHRGIAMQLHNYLEKQTWVKWLLKLLGRVRTSAERNIGEATTILHKTILQRLTRGASVPWCAFLGHLQEHHFRHPI